MDFNLRKMDEANKRMAEFLEKGYEAFGKNSHEVLQNLYAGFQRASWHATCALVTFEEFSEVCAEIRHEDYRAFQNIKHHIDYLKGYRTVLELFFDLIVKNLSSSQLDILKSKIRHASFKSAQGFMGAIATTGTTNRALVYALANLFYSSPYFTLTSAPFLKRSVNLLSFVELYGILQQRIQAANRLKLLDAEFYRLLYSARAEGFYLFLEPALKRYLGYGRPRNEQEVFMMLKDFLL
ncbi:hypothetical protein [Mixta intestinalis]|uniref:Uncharacterized protein n=1 Tax=Mixta intestinalis TaxID=1615494 RepID=A0A6P1PY07_9GAMM|nr:hypothetical protein [Mixta intestinalis]QHM70595.1 hypothetical protein C7M51_00873 [Mixta intestinalis]